MTEQSGRESLLRILEYRKAFDDRFAALDREAPFDSVLDVDTGAPVEPVGVCPRRRRCRSAATPATPRPRCAPSGTHSRPPGWSPRK
ncbi:hypothetical protein [Nocardioides convexus]|uniref:hypothetical protein n=1 Tax=Nocardioides convexus TaxID=2712224 RepID=UPI0024181BAB|nr:hypothetical protein [Nocardioides convexus]